MRYKPQERDVSDPRNPRRNVETPYVQAAPRARLRAHLPEEDAPPTEPGSDVFGSPLPERQYTRHAREFNPLDDFRKPP